METLFGASTVERHLMEMSARDTIPLNGSIELLPLCNMNCDMCYVRLDSREMKTQGTLRTVDEWLLAAARMKEAGTLFLLLTGGEPLLYPHFKDLYLGLLKMGFILTLNTNGTLIDEEWADFFAENRLRRINVTLYGASPDTYERLCHYREGFERTVKGVRLLRERNVDVRVGFSLTPANASELDAMFELVTKLDTAINIDTYMMAATRERTAAYNYEARLDPVTAGRLRFKAMELELGEEEFGYYVDAMLAALRQYEPSDEPKAMECLAGRCSFAVSWLGNLHPCVIMEEPSVNIFEVPFAKAWKQVSDVLGAIKLSKACSACLVRPACPVCASAGMCEAGAYDAVPDYLCQYTGEFVRQLKLYRKEARE